MADFWVVLTVIAFFGLCVAFVRLCDQIIGPDDQSDLATTPDYEVTETADEVGVR